MTWLRELWRWQASRRPKNQSAFHNEMANAEIPWRSGKLLVWDITVVSTLAQSYVAAAARGRGEVAELAAARKCEKYA